jgi:hypothetical protein
MRRLAMLWAVGTWLAAEKAPPLSPADDDVSPRFPQSAGRTPDAGAPVATQGPSPPEGQPSVCVDVPPEAQLSCPLSGRVTSLEPVSRGVRLVVRRRGLVAEQVRAALSCQVSLAAVRKEFRPACSFLSPGMNLVVRERGRSSLSVELLLPTADDGPLGLLRQQVESAFPRARALPDRR